MSALLLRSHPHKHLPTLEVERALFDVRFASGCDTRSCKASCCGNGTTLDVIERDNILAHAELVKRSMSPGQDTDPAHWFDDGEVEDRDLVSGRAAFTRADENGCVFLDAQRLCVLQRASAASGGAVALKPFICAAFPIVIDGGLLCLEHHAKAPKAAECCGPDPGGSLTVFEVCATELEHVVGACGVAELRRLSEDHAARGQQSSTPR